MNRLLDRWRRGPIHHYFAGLDRCDQATAIIVTTLAFAIGIIATAIMLSQQAPAATSSPRFTAPPFLMDFAAAATAGQRS